MMNSDEFRAVLLRATKGEQGALYEILSLYSPLIDRISMIDGTLDEDLRQSIYLRIISAIKNFKI